MISICFLLWTAQAPDEHHAAALHRSGSPEGERGRSVSPMAAHRESQEFPEEEVAQVTQGKPSPDKGSPIPGHQAHNDSVDRSGSFHAENNTTPVRERTTSGGSHYQSSGIQKASPQYSELSYHLVYTCACVIYKLNNPNRLWDITSLHIYSM